MDFQSAEKQIVTDKRQCEHELYLHRKTTKFLYICCLGPSLVFSLLIALAIWFI